MGWREMKKTILRLNENGSKKYDSSWFLSMEVIPNMECFVWNWWDEEKWQKLFWD